MLTRREFLASSAALAASSHLQRQAVDDFCIVGGTSGGVIAAVEVARRGGSVTLLEPGHHLGGMSASGLGWTDFTHPAAIGGLAHEFYSKVGVHYNQTTQLALEPHVAESVFREMANHPKIKVRYGAPIKHARVAANKIQSVVTESEETFHARMFLDATYEGDLLALAGIPYTVGREANSQYEETLNGIQTGSHNNPKTGQFVLAPDPWKVKGKPSSGPLPYLLQDEPLGEPGEADKRLQAYGYRLCLTTAPNRVPIAPSRHYDPARFELLARWIEIRQAHGETLKLSDFMKYDPLPNDKWDFNNRWSISLDFLGGSEGYPNGTRAERRAIERQHEDYLRDLLHFFANEERVPESVRNEMRRFGLCRDEFRDNGGWPHQIYVREARRMISDLVMTEHHVLGQRVADSSVGLASYGIDMHAVRRIVVDGKPVNEGSSGHAVPKPYPVGFESIVPARSKCTNLFVSFCVSASHVGFASIRMEPVFMILSQSAAIAGMMAIDADCAVQDVDRNELQKALKASGQVLDWA